MNLRLTPAKETNHWNRRLTSLPAAGLALALALLLPAAGQAATIVAAAGGDLTAGPTWTGGSAPVLGDANTWQSGTFALTGTNETFNGNVLEITSGGFLNSGVATPTVNLNNLTLDSGGTIENAHNGALTVNLNSHTFTLNGGTNNSGVGGARAITFQNGSLAGNGTVTCIGNSPTFSADVTFASSITTTGFTGAFSVGGNGKLKLPNISQPNVSFALSIASGGVLDNTAAGNNIAVTALTLLGNSIPAGVYSNATLSAMNLAYTNLVGTNANTISVGYSVTYNGNASTGGSVPATNLYLAGGTVTLSAPGTLIKAGSTFSGWNTAANGTGTGYAWNGSTFSPSSFTISGNTTLYAQWAAAVAVITAPATFPSAISTFTGTASSPTSVSISGSGLTAGITATAPTGLQVSSDGITYGPTATFSESGGTASGTLYAIISASAAAGFYNSADVNLTSSGASSVNVATTASGNGAYAYPAWVNPAGGHWGTAANWALSTIASGSGVTADFSQVDITSATTVSLDTSYTVGNLIFGNTDANPAANWILDNGGNSANTLTLAGGTPTVTVGNLGTNETATISAELDGTSGLVKAGPGTLALSGPNNYTGVTAVSGGILDLDNGDNSLGADPATPTPAQVVINASTLASDSATVNANRGIALGPTAGSGSGTIDTITSGTIEVDGVIANNGGGVGSLHAGFLGTGYVKLTGTNTYTGGTVISNGIVELENDQSGANGGIIIGPHNDNVCYLQIDQGANVAVAAGNAVQVGPENTGSPTATSASYLNDYGTVTNNGTLFAGRVSQVTIETGIGGAAGGLWVQNGNMTLQSYGNLGANMTVAAGATNIYNGTNLIQLNGPGTTYTLKATLTISGTFITGEGFTNAIPQTTGTGCGQVTFGGGGKLQLTANVPSLFSVEAATATNGGVHCVINAGGSTIDTGVYTATNYQNITGNGGLTKLGGGKLVMAGTNAYAGNTTVNGGTLAIQQPTLNTNSTITVVTGAALELDFATTNNVKSLVLNGVSQPTGVVYNNGNTGGYLTGVGNLYVPPGTNDSLVTLVVDNAGNPLSLTPAFNGDPTQAYQATNGSGPVTVTVTSADLSAASSLLLNGNYVSGLTSGVPSGSLALVAGSNNVVTIQVVSADTTMTNEYNLYVYQPLSANADLAALVVSNAATALNLNPMFSANPAVTYQGTNAYGAGPVTVTVSNADLTATDTLLVNGVNEGYLTSSIPSVAISLGAGSNSVITVQVVSADSSVTNDYTADVYQQNPSLSPIDTLVSLVLSNNQNGAVSLTPGFGAGIYAYYATNTLPANAVDVTVTDTDPTATNTLIVNGGPGTILASGATTSLQSLNAGANTVTVQVVSQDQAQTNSYTVNVYDQPSLTSPKLTSSVSGGTLRLGWDANHLGYRLLEQTNNQSRGISTNLLDWGTVAGSTGITSTNIVIPNGSPATNEFYQLVYP